MEKAECGGVGDNNGYFEAESLSSQMVVWQKLNYVTLPSTGNLATQRAYHRRGTSPSGLVLLSFNFYGVYYELFKPNV
jgi:hypothetical protein